MTSIQYNLLLGSCLLFISAAAMAQLSAGAQQGINVADHLLIKLSNRYSDGNVGEKAEGSPYLNENFVNGVVSDQQQPYAGVPMRYNLYADQLEYQLQEQLYILEPQPRIRKVVLNQYTLVVEPYEYRGKTRPAYFILLDSGQVVLLMKKVVNYKAKQPPKALESGPTPAKYTPAADVFYYKIGTGEVRKVESIKKMIASFPDKQAQLAAFAKKEKISSRSEYELMKLVGYYNSL